MEFRNSVRKFFSGTRGKIGPVFEGVKEKNVVRVIFKKSFQNMKDGMTTVSEIDPWVSFESPMHAIRKPGILASEMLFEDFKINF